MDNEVNEVWEDITRDKTARENEIVFTFTMGIQLPGQSQFYGHGHEYNHQMAWNTSYELWPASIQIFWLLELQSEDITVRIQITD